MDQPRVASKTARINMYLEAEMVETIDAFAASKGISLSAAARKLLAEALALRGLWKVTEPVAVAS